VPAFLNASQVVCDGEAMPKVQFFVQGSEDEPYRVTFTKNGDNLGAYCTCPAGQNGMYCKHRFRILEGEATGLVSDNVDDILTVGSWLTGTDVAAALDAVKTAEREHEAAKNRLARAKKDLARAMRD